MPNFDASLFRPPVSKTVRQKAPESPQFQLRPQTTKPKSEAERAEHERVFKAFQQSHQVLKKNQRQSTVTSARKSQIQQEQAGAQKKRAFAVPFIKSFIICPFKKY